MQGGEAGRTSVDHDGEGRARRVGRYSALVTLFITVAKRLDNMLSR